MRMNDSSWFSVKKYYDKSADPGVLFGPAKSVEHTSYVYPNEKIKKDEVVIWVPAEHKTVSLKSYEHAHQTQDADALSKISKLGIPLGCTFGGCINLNEQ